MRVVGKRLQMEGWVGGGLTGRHAAPPEHQFPPESQAALRATAPGCSDVRGLTSPNEAGSFTVGLGASH